MHDMSWDDLIRALTGLITLTTGLAGLLKSDGGRRTAIREEAEILEKLREGSSAYETLQALLDAEVAELANRRDWKRNWPMAIFSLICAPGLGYLALWLTQREGWWGWLLATPVALFAIVFLYGLFDSVQLAPRNAKGNREADKRAH